MLDPRYSRQTRTPSPRVRKQNDLFRGGPAWQLNACVGRNGGPYDFFAYSRGYFHAGILLAEQLAGEPRHIDTIVYPLVFLFRHGVELALKDLARALPRLWDHHTEIKLTHRLTDNWNLVKPFLGREPVFDPQDPLPRDVERVLLDFIELDPTGEAFRFPEDRAGDRFLQQTSLINLEVLSTALTKVADAFDYWHWRAEELWQAKCEMELESEP